MQGAGSRRIAVVGAGLAGLAAAWRLREAGLAVTVYEREAAAGGRARHEVSEGFTLEPGAANVRGADRSVLELVAAAGLAEELVAAPDDGLGQVHQGRVVRLDPERPLAILGTPGLPPHQAWRLLRLPRLVRRFADLLGTAAPERAARLDDRCLADFGRLYLGRSALERWLGPTVAEELPCDPEHISRVPFMQRQHSHRGSPRSVLRWGMGALPRALAASLEVRAETAVTRIEAADAGFAIVSESQERGTRRETADAVIVATPASHAGRIADPLLGYAERRFFAGNRSVPALSLALATERPLESRLSRIRFAPCDGRAFSSLRFEQTPGRVPRGAGLLVATASGPFTQRHWDAPDDAVAKEAVELLEPLLPGLRASVRFTRVFRFADGFADFAVGRVRALAQLRACEADARRRGRALYWAGDWTAGPYLENAAASGFRAAAALLADRAA